MKNAMAATVDAMGERAKRMPPSPRAVVNGVTILPLVDEEWHPVKDMWVLPGRGVLTSEELSALAAANQMPLYFT
jgi:hypothetical protein